MATESTKPLSRRPSALRWLAAAGLLVAAGAFARRAVQQDKVEEPSGEAPTGPAPRVAVDAPSAALQPEDRATGTTFLPVLAPSSSAAGRPALSQPEFQAALAATPVTIYTASWCDVCRKTKRFLTVNGLHYREIDVDKTLGGWDKVESLTGKSGVPVVIVDGDISVGLDARSVMRSVARSMERRLGVTGIQFTPS